MGTVLFDTLFVSVCGIGRPPGRMDVADFVLSVPRKEAAEDFEYAVDRAAHAALSLITDGLEKTQSKFNG